MRLPCPLCANVPLSVGSRLAFVVAYAKVCKGARKNKEVAKNERVREKRLRGKNKEQSCESDFGTWDL